MNKNEHKKQVFNLIQKNDFCFKLNTLENVNNGYVVNLTSIKSSKNINSLLDKIFFVNSCFPNLKNDIVLNGCYDDISQAYFLNLGLNIEDEKEAIKLQKQFNSFQVLRLN